jgi:hypothetical protein
MTNSELFGPVCRDRLWMVRRQLHHWGDEAKGKITCRNFLESKKILSRVHGPQHVEIAVTRARGVVQRSYRCAGVYLVTKTKTGSEATPVATTSSLLIPGS